MGAALAFYTLFSIAPLLLIVLSITGFVFGAEAARGEIAGQLQNLMGEQSALTVQALLQNVNKPSDGMLATITGFILMVSLIFNAALSAVSHWWSLQFKEWFIILNSVNLVFGFVMTTAMFALIYKYIPSVKIRWGEVWLGALITAALFTVGKFLIGLYYDNKCSRFRFWRSWLGGGAIGVGILFGTNIFIGCRVYLGLFYTLWLSLKD